MTTLYNSAIQCPHCDHKLGTKAMQSHLRDKHGITGREAHRIANPNDAQGNGRSRRIAPMFRPVTRSTDDDFDVFEDL